MPILPRAVKEAQYAHVMSNLLQRDGESSPLAKALANHFGGTSHKDMDNLISLTSQEIDDLEYEEQVPDP